jgi:hypothetical protein
MPEGLDRFHRHPELKRGLPETKVQGGQGCAMVGANRQVQGVGATQTQVVAVAEMGRDLEMRREHRKDRQGIAAHAIERRQGARAFGQIDISPAELDRKRRRDLGGHPVADN